MQDVGKEIICDRCGKRIFLPRACTVVGNDIIRDFEPAPDGWILNADIYSLGFKDLCPKCSAVLNRMISNFMLNRPTDNVTQSM